MTSSVNIWTSSLTRNCESQVAQIIRATGDCAFSYDSIDVASCTIEEILQKLNEAFQKLIRMTSSDTTLHVIAVIPLFEDSSISQIDRLYKACLQFQHNKTVHIIGLSCNLQNIFENINNTTSGSEKQKECFSLLSSICSDSSFSISYSIIDDFAANGAPIGFTLKSLAKYIAFFQLALIQDYYSILSPSLLSSHKGENLSVGLASLSFDKDYAINQLLSLGFIAALDNVGINNTDVDLQRASHKADMLLSNIDKRYSNFYGQYIKPLTKAEDKTENEILADASPLIEDNISQLKSEILNLLKDRDLTFPEKEAILALVLGRDNANLRGIQYQNPPLILDDVCTIPIDLYVKTYNEYCQGHSDLPIRNDFDSLKLYNWNSITEKFEESPENEKAINPIPEIKRLKQEILNITSFIRDKEDELDQLQQTLNLRKNIEEVKHIWKRPTGELKDIEYKEQPLQDKYCPTPNLIPKTTVDLRNFFMPTRNQLDLGSCTSFAVVAMYEAIMARNGIKGENILSPAYLYYYSNVLNGRPGGGSNFYEQLEILGTHGVCLDPLYTYDTTSSLIAPTQEAEEDAKTHRVLCAKQIPLINDPDKTKTLEHNHKLLTSALSEGYPIGISLKIYDNLGKDGAFILHPDDAKDAKEEGWHAMVIVGYSEENNFYIVRNSWGPEFGENGYCYIPTSYLDDPAYLDFACIITQITDGFGNEVHEVPTTLANFDATEIEIKTAAIRNVISKTRIDLTNKQNLYSEYYKYYQRLLQQLAMPNVQKNITIAADNAQAIQFINSETRKQQLEESFANKIQDYKKYLRNSIFAFTGLSIALGFGWYFSGSYIIGILTLISLVICILAWCGYKWWVRIKRKQLREEVENVAAEAKKQRDRYLEMKIKFNVAGMWLRKYHDLSIEIGRTYDRLVSFNETLREWQKEYKDHLGVAKNSDGQMFRILDPTSHLDTFFQTNKSSITERIDLLQTFESYNANIQQLDTTHSYLKQTVRDAIGTLFDFNITNYLLGDEYPFLAPINLEHEMETLLAVGQPSHKNQAINATAPARLLLTCVDENRKNEWENTILPSFPMRPMQLSFYDHTMLLLITIHPISSSNM